MPSKGYESQKSTVELMVHQQWRSTSSNTVNMVIFAAGKFRENVGKTLLYVG